MWYSKSQFVWFVRADAPSVRSIAKFLLEHPARACQWFAELPWKFSSNLDPSTFHFDFWLLYRNPALSHAKMFRDPKIQKFLHDAAAIPIHSKRNAGMDSGENSRIELHCRAIFRAMHTIFSINLWITLHSMRDKTIPINFCDRDRDWNCKHHSKSDLIFRNWFAVWKLSQVEILHEVKVIHAHWFVQVLERFFWFDLILTLEKSLCHLYLRLNMKSINTRAVALMIYTPKIFLIMPAHARRVRFPFLLRWFAIDPRQTINFSHWIAAENFHRHSRAHKSLWDSPMHFVRDPILSLHQARAESVKFPLNRAHRAEFPRIRRVRFHPRPELSRLDQTNPLPDSKPHYAPAILSEIHSIRPHPSSGSKFFRLPKFQRIWGSLWLYQWLCDASIQIQARASASWIFDESRRAHSNFSIPSTDAHPWFHFRGQNFPIDRFRRKSVGKNMFEGSRKSSHISSREKFPASNESASREDDLRRLAWNRWKLEFQNF